MTAIEGLTALQKRFASISDSRMMLGQIALLAVKEAKDIAPRKTGNLGRTIRLGTVTDTNAQIMAGGVRGVGDVDVTPVPHDHEIIRDRAAHAILHAP